MANKYQNKKDWFKCPKCGFTEYIEIRNFNRRKNKCPECFKKEQIKTTTQKTQSELLKAGFILLTNEVVSKSHSPVSIQCCQCGRIYNSVIAHNWITGRAKCDCNSAKQIKTQISTEDFIQKLPVSITQHFDIVGEYISRNNKIEIKCKKCGLIQARWALGIKCRCDTRSLGEQKIYDILCSLGVPFIEQFSFLNKERKSFQKLDFFLPNHKIAIEFNGTQHYQPVPNWGGEDRFQLQQLLDKHKQEWCNQQGIELVVIKTGTTTGSMTQIITEALGRSTTIPQGSRDECLEKGNSVS